MRKDMYIRYKILENFGFEFFCGRRHNEDRFMPFWPTLSDPGTQPQEGDFCLFWNLWPKNNKLHN